VQNKDKAGLKQLGGLSGVAQAVHSDILRGVDQSHASISDRQAEFGVNQFKELPQKSFWSMVFEGLQDPTLVLLMAAALASIMEDHLLCSIWNACSKVVFLCCHEV